MNAIGFLSNLSPDMTALIIVSSIVLISLLVIWLSKGTMMGTAVLELLNAYNLTIWLLHGLFPGLTPLYPFWLSILLMFAGYVPMLLMSLAKYEQPK